MSSVKPDGCLTDGQLGRSKHGQTIVPNMLRCYICVPQIVNQHVDAMIDIILIVTTFKNPHFHAFLLVSRCDIFQDVFPVLSSKRFL
jgi:hypothetical protein